MRTLTPRIAAISLSRFPSADSVQDLTLARRERLLGRQVQVLRATMQDPIEMRLQEFQNEQFLIGFPRERTTSSVDGAVEFVGSQRGSNAPNAETVFRISQRIFRFFETSISCFRRRLVKMNVPGSRQTFPPEGSLESWWHFEGMSVANLIRVLAAILFWSLLIGAVAFCYELWRLEHNWRLGMG